MSSATAVAPVALLLFLLLVGLFVILIPVLIGIYVHKDAKSRNMDAVLWTIVAVLVPSFIGLIIYLVIRSNNTNVNCPSCKNPIASEYVLCPYCGMPLKDSCPSCSAPVDGGWKLCPKCGAELPEQSEQYATAAAPKKDRKLVWILVAAIAVPVLLLTIGIGGMVAFRIPNTYSSAAYGIDLKEGDDVPVEIVKWVNDCDAQGKGVYVLELSPEMSRDMERFAEEIAQQSTAFFPGEETNQKAEHIYYIYINIYKGAVDEMLEYVDDGSLPRGDVIKVRYDVTPTDPDIEWPDYELSEFRVGGDGIDGFEIFIDGELMEYSLTELD